MPHRFARPTLGRYRSERDALVTAVRSTHDYGGDAGVTRDLVDRARERQRGALCARKALGFAATAPASGLASLGGRP